MNFDVSATAQNAVSRAAHSKRFLSANAFDRPRDFADDETSAVRKRLAETSRSTNFLWRTKPFGRRFYQFLAPFRAVRRVFVSFSRLFCRRVVEVQ
jgi:DeoR/GlpR family transcriptional regulator of sugar metabolism